MIYSSSHVGIYNFADDTTSHISIENLEKALKSLEKILRLLYLGLKINGMKLNTDKCRLIVSGYKHARV